MQAQKPVQLQEHDTTTDTGDDHGQEEAEDVSLQNQELFQKMCSFRNLLARLSHTNTSPR